MAAWTEDRVKILVRMWKKEKSTAGQIAEALGDTTRNAVIGKIHRMGLSRTTKKARDEQKPGIEAGPAETANEDLAQTQLSADPAQEKAEPPDDIGESPPPSAPVEESAAETAGAPAEADEELAAKTPDTPETQVQNAEKSALKLGLLELTERTCKWPYGDPSTKDFWFCGLPSKAGQPYCEAHITLAFQPFASRRDSRSS